MAWLFAHWGPFGRQRRAWPHGADPPHFHMHTGEIGHFFEVWVFPAVNVGLGVDGPHNNTGDLQNTPGTPAMHLPLGAAGSQSALYGRMCNTAPAAQKFGISIQPTLHLAPLVRPDPPGSMHLM